MHIMKPAIAFLLLILSACAINAQTKNSHLRIIVTVEHYQSDSLWFGRSFGRRAVAEKPFFKNAAGNFEIEIDDPSAANTCAAIVYEPSPGARKAFHTLLLAPGQTDFEVGFDARSAGAAPTFKGSEENAAYHRYERELETLRKKRDDAQNNWRLLNDEPSFRSVCSLEVSMEEYQTGFLSEAGHPFVSSLIAKWPLSAPAQTWLKLPFEKAAQNRQQWFKNAYIERCDIASPEFWRSPLAVDWLDAFVFKSAPPHPDSVRFYAETVLQKLEKQPEIWHYYFNYMLNSFENMSRFYYDEVFVYLVRQYVESGKTPGYSPETQQEKIETAGQIARLRVGNPSPPITLFDQNGLPVALDSIRAEWLFLVFFQPDCSHCKKETQLLKTVFAKYQSKGLRVAMVCSRIESQLPSCWQFQKDFELPADWLVLADGKMRSNFRKLYKVDGYPRLFLLDRNKRIIYRRAGDASAAELEQVLKF